MEIRYRKVSAKLPLIHAFHHPIRYDNIYNKGILSPYI